MLPSRSRMRRLGEMPRHRLDDPRIRHVRTAHARRASGNVSFSFGPSESYFASSYSGVASRSTLRCDSRRDKVASSLVSRMDVTRKSALAVWCRRSRSRSTTNDPDGSIAKTAQRESHQGARSPIQQRCPERLIACRVPSGLQTRKRRVTMCVAGTAISWPGIAPPSRFEVLFDYLPDVYFSSKTALAAS